MIAARAGAKGASVLVEPVDSLIGSGRAPGPFVTGQRSLSQAGLAEQVALAQGDLDEAGQEAQLAKLAEIQQASNASLAEAELMVVFGMGLQVGRGGKQPIGDGARAADDQRGRVGPREA